MPYPDRMASSAAITSFVIGIDYSTDPRKVGIAFGVVDGERCTIVETHRGSDVGGLASFLADRIRREPSPVLIAIDAPLGWPDAMRDALPNHRAGTRLLRRARDPFFRETDLVVHRTTGKQPLAIGANLIARTAMGACDLLDDIRDRVDAPLVLARRQGSRAEHTVIEVYPAATLRQLGIETRGYKDRDASERRLEILSALPVELACARPSSMTDHWLDSIVCVVAGHDFIKGSCEEPPDAEQAAREGWIWVRRAKPTSRDR